MLEQVARSRPETLILHANWLLREAELDTLANVIERIRALTDRYDAVFTMAEVGGEEALSEMQLYTRGDHRLNSAYGFDFLYADALTPQLVAHALELWPDAPDMGWPGDARRPRSHVTSKAQD